MTPDELQRNVTLLDHAARQSDRWLFLALLAIGLFSIIILVRYFMKERDALRDEIVGCRTSFENYLKSENAQLVQVVAKNSMVIEQNTRALERNVV